MFFPAPGASVLSPYVGSKLAGLVSFTYLELEPTTPPKVEDHRAVPLKDTILYQVSEVVVS